MFPKLCLLVAFLAGCGAIEDTSASDASSSREGRDAGTTPTDGGPGDPVDSVCTGTCPLERGMAAVFPPYVPLHGDDVPASCHNGFQLGGANGGCGVSVYTLRSTRPGGANA